jgi:hypothetical protein
VAMYVRDERSKKYVIRHKLKAIQRRKIFNKYKNKKRASLVACWLEENTEIQKRFNHLGISL